MVPDQTNQLFDSAAAVVQYLCTEHEVSKHRAKVILSGWVDPPAVAEFLYFDTMDRAFGTVCRLVEEANRGVYADQLRVWHEMVTAVSDGGVDGWWLSHLVRGTGPFPSGCFALLPPNVQAQLSEFLYEVQKGSGCFQCLYLWSSVRWLDKEQHANSLIHFFSDVVVCIEHLRQVQRQYSFWENSGAELTGTEDAAWDRIHR